MVFRFIMISAGFEHGGNVTHRHLDGHSQLLVYPFESQLGNRGFSDFLSSVERVQYRYPEFPEGCSSEEIYEMFIDEEMKTFLRKREGSKFKSVDLKLAENQRKDHFVEFMSHGPLTRARAIEAFFKSTFASWENHHSAVSDDKSYVGYSPAIGIDAHRILRDFPDAKIMHIVRNPFSAYRDTNRRPFPQNIYQYLITWNLYHSTAIMYANENPSQMKIFRYEDLVEDKPAFMKSVSDFLNIPYEESMLYPSWNGEELKGDIAPWGTVLKSSANYNFDIISELSESEISTIANASRALSHHFAYTSHPLLEKFYRMK